MPEYHPGTDIEIPNGIPKSGFRCAIPNTKRYMKQNAVEIKEVCEASYTGDYDLLEEMLASGNEANIFNGDLNQHVNNITALHMAAMAGQTECVELLLKAKADPHVKESMHYGNDPEDGKTALQYAQDAGYDDVVELLEQAEKDRPYGWYIPSGEGNNAKVYGCWEFGKKPPKGFFSSRPGAAEINGFDPMKYGTGPLKDDDDEEEITHAPRAAVPPPSALSAKAIEPPKQATGPPPIPVGLLFPGQGSQYVKMMSTVKDIPAVKAMLAKADEILGYDVLELCLSGPEDKLEETRYCQPAMFIAGLAGLEKLRSEREEAATRFQVTAGLSLGEYTALCAAGVFSFEDGLKLVQLRGQAMQDAAQMSKQAMLSVAGLEKEKLEALCKEAAAKEGPQAVCQIANELFPKGFSCAGTAMAVKELEGLAMAAGALQAKMLKTSGGFHTSLMGPAKERLAKALDETLPRMQPPKHTIYMNTTAKPLKPGTDPTEIIELLKRQLTSPVLWDTSVRAMIEDGVTEFYEVGPMKQIKAMMKRISPKVWGSTTNVEV
jgi:[acyl-carrier-protein] S-malonyltransferase